MFEEETNDWRILYSITDEALDELTSLCKAIVLAYFKCHNDDPTAYPYTF